MRPKLSKMIALAVVDFDMMQAIGMNNGKIVTSTMWVWAEFSRGMAQLYVKPDISKGGWFEIGAIPTLDRN